jgi:hypothetical protein
MDAERLREIAKNLFNSSKASDPRTIGEKAIGILAFQQLGGRCDIVTRRSGSVETLALRLERGTARAELEFNERRRARDRPGTTVYISDLDPDVPRPGIRTDRLRCVKTGCRTPSGPSRSGGSLGGRTEPSIARPDVPSVDENNNLRAASDELAEEMVRMLVRVRRHLPRRGRSGST